MTAKIPKVSVLLATFNGVSFLEGQLASLYEQQDVDIEVMVNDDGSTDGTMEILEVGKKKALSFQSQKVTALEPRRLF